MYKETRSKCMEVVQASFWMDDFVMNERSITLIFLFLPWTTLMDELGVGLFYNTPSVAPLSWVVQGNVQPDAILWTYVFMLGIRCATCHDPIGDWSRLFIFSRSMPRVTFQLVVSFQMLKSTAYKQWNSSATLYISEISFFDIPHLSASSRSFLRLESPFIQIQVFSSFSSSGFKFS